MNTRMIAMDLAEEAPHSLSKRIARFAMAINGCPTQYVSKSYWKQAKRELTSDPAGVVGLADRPTAGTLLP
jgi:hypothetical protein